MDKKKVLKQLSELREYIYNLECNLYKNEYVEKNSEKYLLIFNKLYESILEE